MPSQISAELALFDPPGMLSQRVPVPDRLHSLTPPAHWPRPHAAPRSKSSSVLPSQSSSAALQASMMLVADSFTHSTPPPAAQVQPPFMHRSLSAPSHGSPRLGKASSATPSQVSSAPSQVSMFTSEEPAE